MRPILALAGVLAALWGGARLLFVLPWAAVHNWERRGPGYCLAVLTQLFSRPAVAMTVSGAGLLLAGVALSVRAGWPNPADLELGREGRVALFSGVTLGMTFSLLTLVVAITAMLL